MSIRFACPCGLELQAEAEYAGRATACPQCGRDLIIPASDERPIAAAVRMKSRPAPLPRPPLTNRYDDDGNLARPKGEPNLDLHRPRINRHYDDHEAHDDEEDSRRPRMKRPDRSDEPTGINWTFVGSGVLVMTIAAAWGILSFFLGGIPWYQCIAFIGGLIVVVRGFMGHQRE